MTKSKKFIGLIAIILCIAVVIGLISFDLIKSSQESEKSYIAMGTVVTSKIEGADCAEATEEIEEAISGIEKACLSRTVEDSDIWRINEEPGSDIFVSRETAYWIGKALDICADSNGAFDITIGKLTDLWNIGSGKESVPEKEEIESFLESVTYKNVFVNDTSVKINQGQAIDLGAVGKGIACDSVRDVLDSYDIKSAVVSVGGSILVYGDEAKVGIADPDSSQDYMATVSVKDQCVSTSGDYERFFESDGKKYHHILDPETGYPAVTDLRSVTVVCDSGLDSDALSTACFILGYNQSLELLKKYDAQAVFIFDNNTVSITDGLKDSFEIKSNNYTVE